MGATSPSRITTPFGAVFVATRAQVEASPAWRAAFADHRQDHRYYHIVEDTIRQGFEYRYLVIEDESGAVVAIQPFFVLSQDLLGGAGRVVRAFANVVRRLFPGFVVMRTLMVGCAAGEGHLESDGNGRATHVARVLQATLPRIAADVRASLIVMKEFPAAYRPAMACMSNDGYARIPSYPMTRLRIDGFEDFESYVAKALSKNARKSLRRNLRRAEGGGPIDVEVLTDVTPVMDEVYPLYLQVYDRATMRFEKLTREYLSRLGKEMPDRSRFFVWRIAGRAVAFAVTMVTGDTLYDLYLGMEYPLALDLHLYFYTFRDVLSWAIGQGLTWYCSTPLGYDPKLHLGCDLAPLDLYVRHRWGPVNVVMKRVMPYLEPTRHDPTLPAFSNYHEMWGDDGRR
jgi:predicted N-acyltransferase